jgi:hypothetical protein
MDLSNYLRLKRELNKLCESIWANILKDNLKASQEYNGLVCSQLVE